MIISQQIKFSGFIRHVPISRNAQLSAVPTNAVKTLVPAIGNGNIAYLKVQDKRHVYLGMLTVKVQNVLMP